MSSLNIIYPDNFFLDQESIKSIIQIVDIQHPNINVKGINISRTTNQIMKKTNVCVFAFVIILITNLFFFFIFLVITDHQSLPQYFATTKTSCLLSGGDT